MTNSDLESLAEKTLKKLPPELLARLENVVFSVRRRPTSAQTRKFGRELLGLYEGVPLVERGPSYCGAMPDKIILFRENIEAAAVGKRAINRLVRHTVMHELAHYFGMDDEELLRKGLY